MRSRQHFGDEVTLLSRPRFADLFDVLEESLAQHAILPVENTYAGAVLSAYDLLLENNLHIQGEVILRVHHALLARPGVKLEDLRYVRSHPQALEQCEQFLLRYGLEGVPHFNTAGSARDLASEAWPATGVIASAYSAELYDLEVLAPNIEDAPYNYTRFFVVGTTHAPRSRYNKTSIVFATRHETCALYDCLGELATRDINFTKVESRPRRNRPWEPIFFVDFEGHWSDENCQRALVGLLQRSAFVQLLGSYPGARGELVGI